MRKIISAAALMSAAFYLSIVLLLYLDAKDCEKTHAMFCDLGYVVAGLPWTWVFVSFGESLLQDYQLIHLPLFQSVFVASVLINTLIFYFAGRFVGNAIARRKVNSSSSNGFF